MPRSGRDGRPHSDYSDYECRIAQCAWGSWAGKLSGYDEVVSDAHRHDRKSAPLSNAAPHETTATLEMRGCSSTWNGWHSADIETERTRLWLYASGAGYPTSAGKASPGQAPRPPDAANMPARPRCFTRKTSTSIFIHPQLNSTGPTQHLPRCIVSSLHSTLECFIRII